MGKTVEIDEVKDLDLGGYDRLTSGVRDEIERVVREGWCC
jgi:hypothetical protein